VISIVMPVYDISPQIELMTRKAIGTVHKNTIGEYEMIIVLNGSPRIGNYDDFKPITLPERQSIATAYNIGFQEAIGNYFCCLHNDAFVTRGWNLSLQKEASKGNIAFPEIKGEETDPIPEWMPPGCCFVITRREWIKLGGYDENFEPLHGEDIDLFTRATKAGIKLIRCNSVVYHKRGATRFLLPDKGIGSLAVNLRKWALKHITDEIKATKGDICLPKLSNIDGEK